MFTVLIKLNLEKFQYIATGVAIACLVDIARLSVYSSNIQKSVNESNFQLIIITTIAAFLGAFIGNKMLKRIENYKLLLDLNSNNLVTLPNQQKNNKNKLI